jgi:hypothetical protein
LHQTINHGHSIHRANFLNDINIFALSHEEPPPVHYGDMRENLGGEYVTNVVRRPDGGAVLGIGSHRYDLVLMIPGRILIDAL